MDMIVNSQLIIELRKSKAWSQQHLAEVSGLSLRTVQRIENIGSGAPDSIKAIAVAFGLVPADLMKTTETQSLKQAVEETDKRVFGKLTPVIATVGAMVVLVAIIFIGSSSLTAIANGLDQSEKDKTAEYKIDEWQRDIITQAALTWLDYLDSGDYQSSWQQSDPIVHSQVNAERWQTALEPIRDALGHVNGREMRLLQLSAKLPGLPNGEYAILEFSTQFENNEESIETLPMSKSTGEWRPIGYFIK